MAFNDFESELLEFAKHCALSAGDSTKNYFKTGIGFTSKLDDTPVTKADIEAEKIARDLIEKKYPGHGIIGEEWGVKESLASDGIRYDWVLDPIDGTKSFIKGIPLYTTLVAVLKNDEPLIGVIYNPILNELTWAKTGTGAYYNGTPISVSQTPSLDKAWLQLTDPSDLLRRYPTSGTELIKRSGFTRTWADAQGYALVARGESDVMIDPIMSLWDIACLLPIITEAGGTFTDLEGNEKLGTSCIAGNGILHKEVLAIFQENQYI